MVFNRFEFDILQTSLNEYFFADGGHLTDFGIFEQMLIDKIKGRENSDRFSKFDIKLLVSAVNEYFWESDKPDTSLLGEKESRFYTKLLNL